MRAPRTGTPVFLLLALVFGVLTFILLPLGQILWIVCMPVAAAFAFLAVRNRDEGEDDEDFLDERS